MIQRILELLGPSSRIPAGTATPQKYFLVNGTAAVFAMGTTVPTDTTAGYAPGCLFLKTNGSAGTLWYTNEGSATSSSFKAMATGGSANTYTQTFSTADRTIANATDAALTDSSTGSAGATIAAGVGIQTLSIPLTSLATGLSTSAIDLLTNYTPGYRFKLLSFDFVTTVAGTGSSASQTFNLEIGTTNVTGGSLNVTLASTDTIGKITAGSSITAANVGTNADTLSIEMAASGTVFTAGAGYFVIKIQNMDVADAFASLEAKHVLGIADGADLRQGLTAVIDDLQTKGIVS